MLFNILSESLSSFIYPNQAPSADVRGLWDIIVSAQLVRVEGVSIVKAKHRNEHPDKTNAFSPVEGIYAKLIAE